MKFLMTMTLSSLIVFNTFANHSGDETTQVNTGIPTELKNKIPELTENDCVEYLDRGEGGYNCDSDSTSSTAYAQCEYPIEIRYDYKANDEVIEDRLVFKGKADHIGGAMVSGSTFGLFNIDMSGLEKKVFRDVNIEANKHLRKIAAKFMCEDKE